ncbi:MAG TPA: SDR family NAD(P)-dependent oxidoreductase, partial [Burkholderiales bacterium]|nr:SDR family NAD(P)-dependent oxidoreductase [Burkholderiales bacterium]
DFLATRISYKLNLKGPSLTVQTACSTSMVAVHLACQSLLSEETDLALAGAVSVRVPHRAGYFCDGGGIVSADGHVRAFDASANGTVFGSGGGMLVLKRWTDAERDGDTVYALIKGSAVNNDGAGKAGYTAPGVDSQADAVMEALAVAGVEADTVSYVEAHGSGTPLGDAVEMRALTKAFRSATAKSGFCAIGSVKTNIGHLDAAAGVAGLLKTVLALKARQLPPSLNFRSPNPEIDFPNTPFYVNASLQEWQSAGPRRAAVLSTGMGGTNAVVVLEESPEAPAVAATRAPQLLVLSAATESALDQATARLREHLTQTEVDLGDVARSLQVGRKAFEYRRCLACADRNDAVLALSESPSKRILSGRARDRRRPLVFLLPGIGDQYAGMGRDLYEGWPVFRDEIDRCARILEPHLGTDLRELLYPRKREDPGAKGIDLARMLGRKPTNGGPLERTLFAQAAQFSVEYAASALWRSLGLVPDVIVGHSMGEYVAACLAGVMTLEDALGLIAARAKLVEGLPKGAMLAVTLGEKEVRALLPASLSISLINGPALCVVSGVPAEVAELEAKLQQRGVIARRVANGHAFHSAMLAPIAEPFREEVRKARLKAPDLAYTSNVSGTWITAAEATSPDYWVAHALRAARFDDALRAMWKHKDAALLEVGPGRTLGMLAMQHPERKNGGDPLAIATIRPAYENVSDTEFLLHAIGRLWMQGAEIRWDAIPGRGRKVPLPTYPFERKLHWLQPVQAPDAVPAPVAASVARDPDPARWLYVPSWKRLLPRGAGAREPSNWLIFADRDGFASQLAAKAATAGHAVVIVQAGQRFTEHQAGFTLDPQRSEHYSQLLEALRSRHLLPVKIVHAWGMTGARDEELAQALQRGFYSLGFLVHALGAARLRDEIDLCVLSDRVQDVLGTEAISPEKATLLGACLVIGQEYPNIRVRHVDLDSWNETTVDAVLGELGDPDANKFVALRNGQRWAQTYERITPPPSTGTPPFRQSGVYLITGGLGKVGMAISTYLARKYQARLALVGRRASAPDAAIAELEKQGAQVLYLAADVADAAALRRAVAETDRRFGALHGVIHAAGIVGRDGYQELKSMGIEGSDAHFRAKARGVIALEQALEGRALDFCLLMSSLASILGGLGQAAYAAANLYMDCFARRRRASAVPWLSVNWDIWRLGGESDAEAGATLKDLGMSAAEGMAMMEALLAIRGAPQLVVSTGDLGARVDQWVRMESQKPAAARASASAARPVGVAAAADAPRDETEKAVARVWQDALGIDAVGIHDSFAKLGGHSLLAIRVVAELSKRFAIELPLRALLDAPTVAELARYVDALAWAGGGSGQQVAPAGERVEVVL